MNSWMLTAGLVVLATSPTAPEPTEFQAAYEVPNNCVPLGTVEAYDAHHLAQGGKQMVTLQLRALTRRVAGDAFLPNIIGQGDAPDTRGSAAVFRCHAGPWVGGSLPPLASPYLTVSLAGDDAFFPAPRPRTASLANPIRKLADFTLGIAYSEVKAALNGRGLSLTQAKGMLDLAKGVSAGAAILASSDDPRKRRWLFVGPASVPSAVGLDNAVVALGFDSGQRLMSVAVLSFGKERQVRGLVDRLYQELDTKYVRAPGGKGASYWIDSQPNGAAIALFAGKQPSAFAFLIYTADPLEAVPRTPGL